MKKMKPADADLICTGTLPTAPDLLIDAINAMRKRSAERDNPDERSMARAVEIFNAWKGGEGLSESQGWMFMVCLKMARASGGAHLRDDYIDGAAYLALACECIEHQRDIPF